MPGLSHHSASELLMFTIGMRLALIPGMNIRYNKVEICNRLCLRLSLAIRYARSGKMNKARAQLARAWVASFEMALADDAREPLAHKLCRALDRAFDERIDTSVSQPWSMTIVA